MVNKSSLRRWLRKGASLLEIRYYLLNVGVVVRVDVRDLHNVDTVARLYDLLDRSYEVMP